jgi:hypothetical protein
MRYALFAYRVILEGMPGMPGAPMQQAGAMGAGAMGGASMMGQMSPIGQAGTTGADAMGKAVGQSMKQGVTGRGMGRGVMRKRGELHRSALDKLRQRQETVAPMQTMTAAAQAGSALNQQYQQGLLQAMKTSQMLQQQAQQMVPPQPMMMPMMPGMMQQPGMMPMMPQQPPTNVVSGAGTAGQPMRPAAGKPGMSRPKVPNRNGGM